MNRMAMSSVLVVLLGAAACGGSESPPRTPEPPPPSTTTTTTTSSTTQDPNRQESLASSNMGTSGSQTTASGTQAPGVSSGTPNDARGTTSSSTQGTTGGSSTSSTPTTLTDDQILYVLHSANLGEMEMARVAQKKAQNARVKRFASMMLKDHGEADTKGTEVAKNARASLAPSDVSNRLESDAKQMTASINAEKAGKEFDRTYIDAQVRAHRAVLDSIDRELLPSAKSTEVKDLLQTVRPKIEGHLREAQDIQKGLGGS
jgi:putative membrane protein